MSIVYNNKLDQTFLSTFDKTVKKSIIFGLLNSDPPSINKVDIEICEFLGRFTFATADQVGRFLNIAEQKAVVRLEKMIKNKLVVSFFISDPNKPESIMEDKKYIYCLNSGGHYIIDNYSNFYDGSREVISSSMKDSGKVSNKLICTEIYLKYRNLVDDNLKKFVSTTKTTNIGTSSHTFAFNMIINIPENDGGKTLVMVGEIFRNYDEFDNLSERLLDIKNLYSTNTWKKVYRESTLGINHESDLNPPLPMLIIVENDEMLTKIAEDLFYNSKTSQLALKLIRFITIDNLLKDDFAGITYRYDDKSKKLKKVNPPFKVNKKEDDSANI